MRRRMNEERGVEDFCFVEEFKLVPNYGKIYKTTLTNTSIIYETNEKPSSGKGEKIMNTILLSDVIGARSSLGSRTTGDENAAFIHIYSYPLKKRKFGKEKRERVEHVFFVGSSVHTTAVAEKWVNSIKWLLSKKCGLNNVKEQRGSPAKLQFLVIINPYGGKGIAQKVFNKKVKPMLDEAEVDYEVKITEHADHAKEIIQNFDVMKLDCILSCSGDGLLHEVVNGLMNRADYKDAIKTPLGHVPCGSGNGLCATTLHRSGEPFDIISSVFIILTGTPAPLDIVKAETSNSEIHYCFLGIAMGFVADVDVESEKYRYFGDARFTYMAVKNILKRRRFSGKVWYLPLEDYDHTDHQEPLFNCHDHEQFTESHQLDGDTAELPDVTFQEQLLKDGICASGIQNVHLPNIHDPLPNSWKCIEGNFIGWSFVTLSHIGKGLHLIPGAELGGGIIYCVYLAGDMPRKELMAVFTKIEQGEHLCVPGINVIKARAFRLEPYSAPSKIITIDGESLEYGKLQAEVYKGLGRVRCCHTTETRS